MLSPSSLPNRTPSPWLPSLAIGLALGVWSCSGSADGGNATVEPETTPQTQASAGVQAAYDAGMAVHDEVMPRLGEMMRMQRSLDAADLPAEQTAFAKTRLARADDAMMEWMQATIPVPEAVDSFGVDAAPDYFARREADIQGVRDSIETAIRYAQNLLAQ